MTIQDMLTRAKKIRTSYSELEKEKYGKEWTSQNIMEGFVGDVGDLMKIVMAKEGLREMDDIDEKLSHELADCLWSILILSDKYGVDIEQAFEQTMNELEERMDKNKL